MKRADVAAIDAKLDAAARERDALCARMVSMTVDERAAAVPALVAATEAVNALQFERSEKIRETFFRPGGAQ